MTPNVRIIKNGGFMDAWDSNTATVFSQKPLKIHLWRSTHTPSFNECRVFLYFQFYWVAKTNGPVWQINYLPQTIYTPATLRVGERSPFGWQQSSMSFMGSIIFYSQEGETDVNREARVGLHPVHQSPTQRNTKDKQPFCISLEKYIICWFSKRMILEN